MLLKAILELFQDFNIQKHLRESGWKYLHTCTQRDTHCNTGTATNELISTPFNGGLVKYRISISLLERKTVFDMERFLTHFLRHILHTHTHFTNQNDTVTFLVFKKLKIMNFYVQVNCQLWKGQKISQVIKRLTSNIRAHYHLISVNQLLHQLTILVCIMCSSD